MCVFLLIPKSEPKRQKGWINPPHEFLIHLMKPDPSSRYRSIKPLRYFAPQNYLRYASAQI